MFLLHIIITHNIINIDQNIHHIGKIVEGNEVLLVNPEGRQLDLIKMVGILLNRVYKANNFFTQGNNV